jgi:hypothetical protein
LNRRHFTAFRLVKHIQGKAHLANLLKDKDAEEKVEILAMRWDLHQLLEDKDFFRDKAGISEPIADFKPEVIWRAEMQHDHDKVNNLKDGNNFETHGIARLSDSCFLYKCEHCPDARITDPSKAFKHMTENKYHGNKVYWVNDERKKTDDAGAAPGGGTNPGGPGSSGQSSKRLIDTELGNEFQPREYGDENEKKKQKTNAGQYSSEPRVEAPTAGTALQAAGHDQPSGSDHKPDWHKGAAKGSNWNAAWTPGGCALPPKRDDQNKGQGWGKPDYKQGGWAQNKGDAWGKSNWSGGQQTGKSTWDAIIADPWKSHG